MKYNFDTSWMDNSPLRELIFSIEREGGVAYLVGGCIRNGLLGKDVLDFDIATDVLPDQIIKIAEKNG